MSNYPTASLSLIHVFRNEARRKQTKTEIGNDSMRANDSERYRHTSMRRRQRGKTEKQPTGITSEDTASAP